MHIREFRESDRKALLDLWQACGLLSPGRDAHADIDCACSSRSQTLLIGTFGSDLVASVMLGVEDGRGWTAYEAAKPESNPSVIVHEMMTEARLWLRSRGAADIAVLTRSAC